MADVKNRKCRIDGCGKGPLYGVAGTKPLEYCAQHASDGILNVDSRKWRTESYGHGPSYGVKGTKTT